MMQLYGVVVLLLTLSTACGLKCYMCLLTDDPKTCTKILTCVPPYDICASIEVDGLITKGCFISSECNSPIQCCKGDLCNSGIPTGSSVLLLLVSSAITMVFL